MTHTTLRRASGLSPRLQRWRRRTSPPMPPWCWTATDNQAGIYGLTPDSIRAGEEGPVWLTGEYFADSLALPEGVTAADIEVALRNIGIFLK